VTGVDRYIVTAGANLGQTEGMEGGTGGGSPDLRISDDDRQQVTELLRRHTADGRLTLDEFAERVGVALAARTRSDLEAVTADLPRAPEPVPETRRKKARRLLVAVMSGATAKGRWRTGRSVTCIAVMGSCHLDFRRAEIDFDEVVVTAVAVMGGIDIVVPEGIDVELTGLPIMGGKHMKLADVPVLPGSPRIVVHAFPIMGGVHVRSRPDKGDEPGPAGDRRRDSSHHHQHWRDAQVEWQQQQRQMGDQWRAQQAEMAEQRDRTREELRQRRKEIRDEIRGKARELERRHRGGQAIDLADLYDVLFTRPAPVPVSPASGTTPPAAPQAATGLGRPADDEPLETDVAGDLPGTLDGTVTIMFSDIAGYAEITERLGDLAAHDLLREHNRIVRDLLVTHAGYEVKAQGDGFMVAFSSAARALRCAIGIQKAFEKYGLENPDEPIRVHVGLHTGEAVRDGGDFLGRTVIVASRLTGIAGPGEILVSSLLRELTDSSREFRFGEARQVILKGMSAPQTAYPVEWRDA